MLFKKRPLNESRRTRKPAGRDAAVQPVFSYHARSSRTEPTGARIASKLPWVNQPKASPRKAVIKWPKRTVVIGTAILVVALSINSLFLGRNPEVVALAEKDNRQVFLRSMETYQQAAQIIMGRSLANTNKLTVDTKEIAQTMQKQFPELESVTVTLPVIGRQPVIYIQPAKPALLVKTGASIYIVDTAGRALINASQVPKAEKLGLFVVEDQSGLPITLGRTTLPSADVAFITEVMSQLKAKNISVTGLILPSAASELDVKIEGVPYIVKFNLRGDARAEAGSFLAVKQHLEREKKTPGSYIDVRVDNKAYYR